MVTASGQRKISHHPFHCWLRRRSVTEYQMRAGDTRPDVGRAAASRSHHGARDAPRWADTPGVSRSLPTFRRVIGPLLRNPEQGVDTLVWLAADDGAPLDTAGLFWLDRRPRPIHRLSSTRRVEPSAAWSYPTPNPAYGELAGMVAFYPALMDACFVDDERGACSRAASTAAGLPMTWSGRSKACPARTGGEPASVFDAGSWPDGALAAEDDRLRRRQSRLDREALRRRKR